MVRNYYYFFFKCPPPTNHTNHLSLRDKPLDICEEGWKSGFGAQKYSWITHAEIIFSLKSDIDIFFLTILAMNLFFFKVVDEFFFLTFLLLILILSKFE